MRTEVVMGYKFGGKDTTDGQHSLDVNWLNRHGYLTSGRRSSVRWTRRGEETGNIGLRAESGQLVLVYRSRSHGGEWEDVEEPIRLTWMDCNYGGQRPWFICPGAHCGRRVGKLYGAGKYFLCRHCYNLAYESQREQPRDRLLRKVQGIRSRLGGSMSTIDPFPRKPKGMHWKTYMRIYQIAQDAELQMWGAVDAWLKRLENPPKKSKNQTSQN